MKMLRNRQVFHRKPARVAGRLLCSVFANGRQGMRLACFLCIAQIFAAGGAEQWRESNDAADRVLQQGDYAEAEKRLLRLIENPDLPASYLAHSLNRLAVVCMW